jgi:hypothetical protein
MSAASLLFLFLSVSCILVGGRGAGPVRLRVRRLPSRGEPAAGFPIGPALITLVRQRRTPALAAPPAMRVA